MKSHIELWSTALDELGSRCSVSTALDLETVERRYAHEGDKFFTITLPAFGKDFERCLSLGHIPRDAFQGWSRRKFTGEELTFDFLKYSHGDVSRAPKFLGGFMDRVFDKASGALFDDYPGLFTTGSDIDAVHAIRQLTLMFGKLKVLPDQKQVDAAFDRFIEIERDVTSSLEKLIEFGAIPHVPEDLKKVFYCVFGDAVTKADKAIFDGELTPRHGPGATADRKMGNQKYYQSEWTDRLEQIFSYMEYALPNHRYHEKLKDVTWLSPEQERPVRVIAVPKTAKTPRIIAEEPTCMQYMQQAVSGVITPLLEVPRLNNRANLSSYFVGFADQVPNQDMACIGSEDGTLATLDLSEASDRVPNWLVEALFEDVPWLSEAIQATRSIRADVPGHGVIPLVKYASMGSALTFPIEAVVFATISLWAIAKSDGYGVPGRPYSWAYFRKLKDQVRVYGDDIIVPTDKAVLVCEALEIFGLKVNRDKSFWTGRFRESCGKEYYRGEDVSIVRYRKPIPTPKRAQSTGDWTEEVLSTVSTRNQFYVAGMWKSAELLDDVLETVLKGWYPYVGENSPVLGRFSYTYSYDVTKVHKDTQAPLVRGFVPYSKLPRNEVSDEAALLKCLISSSSPELSGSVDTRHLTHSGRPRAVGIKLANRSPF